MGNRLDEELAEAAHADDVAGEAPPASTEGVARGLEESSDSSAKSNKNLGLLIALLAMVGAVVALVFVGFDGASVYEVSVKELVSGEHTERKVRVGGDLVPGSLAKKDSPCEYKFVMESEGERMEVRYPQCVIPDTFRDRPEGGVEVTVEGMQTKEGYFEASLVMAKCTSKYDPATHELETAKGDPVPDGMKDVPAGQPVR